MDRRIIAIALCPMRLQGIRSLHLSPYPAHIRPARPWQARLPFFYGWIIVAIAFCMGYFSLGLGFVAGLLLPSMQAEVAWSRSAVLGAVAIRGLMGIVISPIFGHYVDRPHGALGLAVSGGIISSIGLAAISIASTEWHFLVLFGVLGGVAGILQGFMISTAIVPKWFVRLRGLTGALTTMGGASSAIGMPILIPILEQAYGWRGTWVALAVLAFIITTIPALLIIRQPEDIGLLTDGDRELPYRSGSAAAPRIEHTMTAGEALGSPGFWVLVAGTSLGMLSQTAMPTNMPLMLADRGFSKEAAVLGLTGFGIASVSLKLFWGTLAVRFPLRSVLIVVSIYTAICTPIIIFAQVSESWQAFAYALLIGSSVGGFVAISGSIWAEYYGRAHLGRITGLTRPFGIVSSWGGVWLMAYSADQFGSYDPSLVFMTVTWLLCAGAIFIVRPPRGKSPP
ncbi:MAG: MFS transporter [Chloroflexota bacterium]